MIADAARVGDSKIGMSFIRVYPPVNAGNSLGCESPGRFFQGFSNNGRQQAFTVLEVACGLIDDRGALLSTIFAFLDDQETSLVLDDGGYGDSGCPSHSVELYAILGGVAPLVIVLAQDY